HPSSVSTAMLFPYTTLFRSVARAQPKLVIEPGTERELAEILRLSNEAGLAVIPRGGGTKLGWGNSPARADLILSTVRMTEIIERSEEHTIKLQSADHRVCRL